MSTPEPGPGMYKIEIEFSPSWTETLYDWRIYRWEDVVNPVAKGSASTRWGAVTAAKWNVRRAKKGKLPAGVRPNPEVIWVD